MSEYTQALSYISTRRDDLGDSRGDASLPAHPDDLPEEARSEFAALVAGGQSMFWWRFAFDPHFRLWCIATGVVVRADDAALLRAHGEGE